MSQLHAEMVAAAVSTARALGATVDDPIVLHERHGLIVHLRPAPLVARVARTAAVVRPELQVAAQAVTFAAYLAESGAPVCRPMSPTPVASEHGYIVTLWELLEHDRPLDAGAAGAALRVVHERAAAFTGSLRSFDPRPEALALCDVLVRSGCRQQAALIGRAVERLELPAGLVLQPIHGDAHLGNVIQTAAGPAWIDLEDVCIGPREWDLACLLHRGILTGVKDTNADAALEAYGVHDRDLVDALAAAVMLWVAPWAVYADSLDCTVSDWTTRRLEWLERRFA